MPILAFSEIGTYGQQTIEDVFDVGVVVVEGWGETAVAEPMGLDEVCGIADLGADETEGEESDGCAEEVGDGCLVASIEAPCSVLVLLEPDNE